MKADVDGDAKCGSQDVIQEVKNQMELRRLSFYFNEVNFQWMVGQLNLRADIGETFKYVRLTNSFAVC